MAWYKKFLSVYNRPYAEADNEIISHVRSRILTKQSDQPLASVVLIAHNEEPRMLACLWSLAENECRYPIEIVGVDNSSVDRTGEIYRELGVRTLLETRKSPGFARQCGLENARGKYHLCIDSDTIYPKHYIETMVDALERPGVVGVVGLTGFFPDKLNSRPGIAVYQFFRGMHLRVLFRSRPELCTRGMSFGFITESARKYGFRTDIRRGEDGSMAFNLKNDGRLVLVGACRARCVTETKSGETGKPLLYNFTEKFVDSLRNPLAYIRRKKHYEDHESNMMP